VAVFAMGAIGASTASAHRTWWYCAPNSAGKFENSLCSKAAPPKKFEKTAVGPKATGLAITAKTKQEPLLISEVDGVKVEVLCKKLKLRNTAGGARGLIYNEEPEAGKKTGRDEGKIIFEECTLAGPAATLCKLTVASETEIITPPTSEGRSLLVEKGVENAKEELVEEAEPIYDNFLPEGKATGEVEKLFAIIHLENNGTQTCPATEDKVKSLLPVGAFLEPNEGEGGVAGEIVSPKTYAKVKIIKFPCTSTKKAWNWKKHKIHVGEFADFTPLQQGASTFCAKGSVTLEVEVELVNGDAWDAQ
jgi:hypothetical protein